ALGGAAIGAGSGAPIGSAAPPSGYYGGAPPGYYGGPPRRCAQWAYDYNGNRVCTAFYCAQRRNREENSCSRASPGRRGVGISLPDAATADRHPCRRGHRRRYWRADLIGGFWRQL